MMDDWWWWFMMTDEWWLVIMVDDHDSVHGGDHEINEPPWNLAQCLVGKPPARWQRVRPIQSCFGVPSFWTMINRKVEETTKNWPFEYFRSPLRQWFLFGSGCAIPSSRLDIFSGPRATHQKLWLVGFPNRKRSCTSKHKQPLPSTIPRFPSDKAALARSCKPFVMPSMLVFFLKNWNPIIILKYMTVDQPITTQH